MSRKIHALFVGFTISVLYSVQLPLSIAGSNYASLNLSDGILLIIGLVYLYKVVNSETFQLSISLIESTTCFTVVGAWIVVSLIVAAVRSPSLVLPNVLWTLKWFEVLGLFLLGQQFAERISWDKIISVIVWGAVPIAIITIAQTITSSGWVQPTVFWNNPSTLGIFLALPGILCLAGGTAKIRTETKQGISILVIGLLFILGVGATGSRAGMLTVVVGAVVIGMLAQEQLSITVLGMSAIAGVSTGLGILWITGRSLLLERFFPFAVQNGTLVLEGTGSRGIQIRFRLIEKGIDLWVQRPIFGYGWFASPENPIVGFLDFFYIQILVDVGIIGFVLVFLLYLQFTREFISRRQITSAVVSVGGTAWLIGLLAAGVGGAHPRVPRFMFLLMLLLIATTQLKPTDTVLSVPWLRK